MTSPQHGLTRVGSVVVLSGDMLKHALQAVLVAAKRRKDNAAEASPAYAALAEALHAAMAANGHPAKALNSALSADGREPVAQQPNWVSTREAARRLGCSERNARRIAERVGWKVGRDWQVPADALPEEE